MKNLVTVSILSLVFLGTSCLKDNVVVDPPIIIEPPFEQLIGKDSITKGAYLGIEINAEAEKVYTAMQGLKQSKGIAFLNVVGEGGSDVKELKDRLKLYGAVFLDEKVGTDRGVQFTFEEEKVKVIYLNSGKQLSQWPEKENMSNSVRIGDKIEDVYNKLVKVKGNKTYAKFFERISLFSKDLNTGYDQVMTKSPQWYVSYTAEPNVREQVQIFFDQGKVKYVLSKRYKTV